jgi:predicted Zn-dependent peptidase
VLSQNKTAPTIAVGVYYNIGFRIEPKNRTGFAHLFEHMMFQGSQNLGKMEFVRLVQKERRHTQWVNTIRFYKLFRGDACT